MRSKLYGAVLAATLVGAAQFASAEPVTWRFYGAVPVSHQYAKKVTELFERIEARTNGEFQIRYTFYGETPYKGTDALKVLRDGQVPMTEWLPSWDSGTYPILASFELPFLMPKLGSNVDLQAAQDRAFASPTVVKSMEEILGQNGGQLLATYYYEPRNIWMNVPVPDLDSLSGKSIQATTPDVSEMVLRMGAHPAPIATQDLYQALQRNTLDGIMGGVGLLAGNKLNEVLKAGYVTNMSAGTTSILVSKAALDALDPAFRDVLIDETQKFQAEMRKVMTEGDTRQIEALRQSETFEVNDVSAEDYDRLRSLAIEYVWPAWAKRHGANGEAVVEEIRAAAEAVN